MADTAVVSPESINRVAVEIVRFPIASAHQAAVAGLLNALAADMQAFRKMDLEKVEPATTYAAAEGQP